MDRETKRRVAWVGILALSVLVLAGCGPFHHLDKMLERHHMKRMTIPGTREPGTLVEVIKKADYLISDPEGAWTDWQVPDKQPIAAESTYHLDKSDTVDIEFAFDVLGDTSGPQKEVLVANLKAYGAVEATVTFTEQFYWAVNLTDMTQRVNDGKIKPGAMPYLHNGTTKLVTEIWGAKLVYQLHKKGGGHLDINAPALKALVKAVLKLDVDVDEDLNITFHQPMAIGYRLAAWQGEYWRPLQAAGTVGLEGTFEAEKRRGLLP